MSTALVPPAAALDRPAREAVRFVTAPQALLGLGLLLLVAGPSVLLGASLGEVLLVVLGLTVLLGAGLTSLLHRRPGSRQRAEVSTRETLRTAGAERAVDGWIEALDLPGGPVGHVVLNPAGVFVVASSWHGVALTGHAMHELAARVADDAERTRTALHARGATAGVRPVVVVWGAGEANLPAAGLETDDVLFLRGSELAALLRWSASSGGAWTYQQAADCLLDLADVPATARILTGTR